jgi:hypothetical protein
MTHASVVVPLRDGQPMAACLISEFARRYGNPKTVASTSPNSPTSSARRVAATRDC